MEAVQRAEEQEEEDEAQEELDGGIVSMHLRNFFCHENLEIRFNRNVNFIVGRNGSGKSAVLTALVVGLGARASATNRGNALHAFIKKGANSATVEIKIKNSSAKAFKHHLYGDYITIVRHITASGATNYKAKAASGEVVSTKLEEVHAITLAHDIQVDNPISVLNQDEARNFHASDAKKKFALFRKATNLDQTESNYRRALENLNKAKSIWGRKKEAYTDLEKELMKWEQIYEHLQSHEEVVAREKRLQDEFYWSDVEEFQKEVTTIQAQYDKQNNRVQKLLDKLQSMEQNFGSNNDTIESMKEQLKEKTHKRKALEEELSQLSSGLREVQTEWRSVQHRLSKQNDLVKREKKKVQDLEKEITNINTGSAAEKRAELERAVRVAEQAAEVVHARYDTAQNDASQAQQHMQRAQAAADQSSGRMQHHQDKLKHLKMQLRELDSRGTDSLAVYGNMMVELKQKIQEATARKQFSEPPRGPVGSYIKVKDKKWAGSLEHIIGGSMKTFCVNTPEDSRRLFEIMRQVYGTAAKPGVTCSKFLPKQHNVSRNKVCAAGYVSALDSMDISDPVIANFLIDNVGVESILLVPDHDDAVRLSDDVENVPQNCSKIVTLDGTEYHPAPNYRSYGGAGRPSRFLQVSTQERRKQVQMEMAQVEREVEEARKVAEECARESEHAVQAERDAARTLHALLRARHEKDAAKQRAADELQMLQAPHHQVLVEELDVSKEKLLSLENDLKQTAERDNGYKQRMDTCEANINAVKQKLGKVAQTISKLTEEIGQEQLKLDQGITRRQTYMQQIREDQDILSELLRRLDESKAQLEEKSTAALALCPRVDNPRERATVAHELKKLQVKLRSMRTEGLNKQEVAAKLLDVRRKHNTTKYMLNKIEALIEEAKQTSREHLNYCSSVQTFIARRVQYCFQSILTLRGYSGRMEIDDTRGVLEIWCTGRESSQKRIAATTSSLSGGERSYSTVAFIMALWECVELPFYFMDEFDVFMDNVNRKIIMELLVDHALKNTNRQFVFLTPQDASSVTAGPNIKIHRMADPRRD